ncbi:EcsC family protein [Nocardioides bruguierae]|uniref:EcsC family protein n=1 Tax=Nocardioides bruguierae TaxID=2945102 RepID=A0A9X2D801_9ACTN|nr:EcsC family protein [Nocardioides bruguierae]MCL8026792.1 EcsC family protein [Nocardioides bruguierae]MCM0621058.1 EcsC family protein [Nocardioides bruguierae]
MSRSRSLVGAVGRRVAPKVTGVAPGLTSTFVRQALERAIAGVGPLPSAAAAASTALTEHGGDAEKAVRKITEDHTRYAGAQGFVTNIGGLVTSTVLVPANISGLALVQSRMLAVIAHLRGYDLEDLRTRNAILALLLGEDRVDDLVSDRTLPAPPMALATAPAHDRTLHEQLGTLVATELVERMVGKRAAVTIGRRVPFLGGVVGLGADGYSTWKVGRYAERELLVRRKA